MNKDKDNKDLKNEEELDTDPGDDVVFEENTEVTGADHNQKIAKLKAKIKELEEKNGKLLDSWQRDKADFINARKKDDEARQEFLKFAKADIISELLPVLDAFESAFKNKEAWEKVDQNWRRGVEYIHSHLNSILSQHGLKVINPIGEIYDPKRDEAVGTEKVDSDRDEGKILDVISLGYELNGKEIRPPKVRVGHYEK